MHSGIQWHTLCHFHVTRHVIVALEWHNYVKLNICDNVYIIKLSKWDHFLQIESVQQVSTLFPFHLGPFTQMGHKTHVHPTVGST